MSSYEYNDTLGMKELCQYFGVGRVTMTKYMNDNPDLPFDKVGGKITAKFGRVEAWTAKKRAERARRLQQAAAGTGEIHTPTTKDAEANAADDFRYIMLTGNEPATYWRNAMYLFDAPPADICIGLGLALTASWGIAVEKAERLVTLPGPKKALALKSIAERLAARHTSDVDEVL